VILVVSRKVPNGTLIFLLQNDPCGVGLYFGVCQEAAFSGAADDLYCAADRQTSAEPSDQSHQHSQYCGHGLLAPDD
jgi:hypothetical protein